MRVSVNTFNILTFFFSFNILGTFASFNSDCSGLMDECVGFLNNSDIPTSSWALNNFAIMCYFLLYDSKIKG